MERALKKQNLLFKTYAKKRKFSFKYIKLNYNFYEYLSAHNIRTTDYNSEDLYLYNMEYIYCIIQDVVFSSKYMCFIIEANYKLSRITTTTKYIQLQLINGKWQSNILYTVRGG